MIVLSSTSGSLPVTNSLEILCPGTRKIEDVLRERVCYCGRKPVKGKVLCEC